jgi:hypothetical protein
LAAPLDRVSEIIVQGKRAVKRDNPGQLHVLTIAGGDSTVRSFYGARLSA